jgi:hypothetical protein
MYGSSTQVPAGDDLKPRINLERPEICMKHPFRTLRGKLAVSVISLAMLTVVAGLAVFSAFSSTATSGTNTFASGSVQLSTNGTGVALFAMPAMSPGDNDSRCVEITYTGSLPADVQFYGTFTGAFAPYLDTVVTRGTFSGAAPAGNGCTGFIADAGGGELVNDTLDQLPTSLLPLTDPAPQWVTNDAHVYMITVSLPANAVSASQGLSTSGSLTWQAQNQ